MVSRFAFPLFVACMVGCSAAKKPKDAGTDGASDPDAGEQDDASGDAVSAPGGYHVVGKAIYDSNGNRHFFHGVSRPSLEWNAQGESLGQQDYTLMKSWHANVVRLPLNQDFWLSGSASYKPGYAATVDQQVQWIEGLGMDVILDLHWSDRGTLANAPGQQKMADTNSLVFWQQVAAKYKNDGRVMFELYNEPQIIPWNVWRDGGTVDGWTAAGMQQLYDAVRSTGANNIVFVGGINWAFDLSGVSSNKLNGVNIVYVTHPYDQGGKQPANWDTAFGTLSATQAVMATEFGNTASCDTSYIQKLIPYLDMHEISWAGWAWYVKDCNFPSLITAWGTDSPSPSGQIVKTALLAY
jgi:hypothetical protein